MSRINWTRVILGGLLAGLLINTSEFILNGVILEKAWGAAMGALGKPTQLSGAQIAMFNVFGFLIGIFGVWLYAAIRPRYGAGPRTAVIAGLAVWILGYLLPNVGPISMDIFPVRLMLIGITVGLVEAPLAMLLGAWIYKEEGVLKGERAAARGA